MFSHICAKRIGETIAELVAEAELTDADVALIKEQLVNKKTVEKSNVIAFLDNANAITINKKTIIRRETIMKKQFAINGMSCNHCVANVEKAINQLDGIDKVKINLKKNQGVVKFDEAQVSADQIAAAVTEAGYETEVI